MKFEEVLSALKDGKKIKRKPWKSDQYICLENGDNLPLYYVLEDDWEIVEKSESTYDWEYIIDNKCLCWFWDSDFSWAMCGTWGQIEKGAEYEFTMFDEAGNRSSYKHCRPVRKDEINFYEDREDEDNS